MKEIILFGAGKYGRAAVNYYGLNNIQYFVDNNSSKWGYRIFDIPVISPAELKDVISKNKFRVIITSRIYKDIIEQLENMGIMEYELYSNENKKLYYPTKEVVLNPYENVFNITEKQWNAEMMKSPMKRLIRLAVNELYEETPLFDHVEIETINRCNGICSFCPVNAKRDTREKKVMSWKLFKKIIKELEELNYEGRISLFSNNEPMLDDRIIELHQYAKKHLTRAWFHLFTNGTLLTLDKFIELHPLLDELIIDNYNQELELIPNSRIIKEYCKEHIELREKVTIVLRKPNEILTSRGGDAPNRSEMFSYKEETCVLPFKQLIVRPDGKVSLCCNDPLGKNTMGDLTKESVLDIWYGQKFKQVREALYKGRGEWKHCTYCDNFSIG